MPTVTISELHDDGSDSYSDIFEADSWAGATMIVCDDLSRTGSGVFNLAVMEKWLTLHDGDGSFEFTHADGEIVWKWRYEI
jgi:hypothetical protein